MTILAIKISQEEIDQLAELYPNLSTGEAYHRLLRRSLHSDERRVPNGAKNGHNVIYFRRKEDKNKNALYL